MVVDSSAILAVLFDEEEASTFLSQLAGPQRHFMSAVNWLEASIVCEARKGEAATPFLLQLLSECSVQIIPFDASQAAIALDTWRRYGKGRHPASLNMGDCAAYALARTLNDTLLYKGDDFSKTDIASLIEGTENKNMD